MKRSGVSPKIVGVLSGAVPSDLFADEIFVVEDDDGRRLVLRDPRCVETPYTSDREVCRFGALVAPSFEREGERHKMTLRDGYELDGGITGAAPTRMTRERAEKWIALLKRGRVVELELAQREQNDEVR